MFFWIVQWLNVYRNLNRFPVSPVRLKFLEFILRYLKTYIARYRIPIILMLVRPGQE